MALALMETAWEAIRNVAKSTSMHRIVVAHIDRDHLLILNQQHQRDAVRQVDRHRVQSLQLAAQSMQAQRRVAMVDVCEILRDKPVSIDFKQ